MTIQLERNQLKPGSFQRPMNERIAFYLAGQAVAARIKNVSVLRIISRPDELWGRLDYPTLSDGPLGIYENTEMEWRERQDPESIFDHKHFQPRREVFLSHLIVLLAGASAEREYGDGICHFNYQGHNKTISDLILFYCPCYRHGLKLEAIRLLRKHGDAVFQLARHLTTPNVITDDELHEILSPFSLAQDALPRKRLVL